MQFLLFFDLHFSDSTEFSVCFVSFYGLISSYFIIVSFAFLYFTVCEFYNRCFFDCFDLFVLAVFLCGTIDFVSGCFAVFLPFQSYFFLLGSYGQFCYFCRFADSLCSWTLISVCAIVCVAVIIIAVIAVSCITSLMSATIFNQVHSKKYREDQYAVELKKSAEQAREASEAKTRFLFNMSHDIRTPMNAIIGFSDIIAEHPDDEEIVKNAISKIQASGEILLKIINDVLDLSKIESGKAEIVEMVTDLKQMEENLKMMLEYSIQKGMIDFKVEDQIENPLVWCDATKLQQVLVNVLNNAVKFTPAGGTITFSCVQRMIAPGFVEYKFTIKDTGIGMTEEFQKHAFEAFERERTSTESKTEGTGLGLAIVKKLVDLMHGDVIIQSNSGQGTKIQISLPLRIATKNQLHQSDKAKEYKIGLDGMHVLLVEDNELNAEIAMEVLKNKGILVNWVPDGCACVEEIQDKEAGTYQFILMDVQMPRMNGYEATQKIRQLADVKKAQIPIIAMTANAFEEDRKHALDAGMDGFIMKPFRVDEMMKVIGEVME